MTKPRVIAIVQARMASARLPGKVLVDIKGRPMLDWVVRRARRARLIDELVVATSVSEEDDAVAAFCQENEIAFVRGSMLDVLDRYYQAAKEFKADVIVRITGDCPLIDPSLLDANLSRFLESKVALDFAANRLPGERTIPIGLDTEICTFSALEIAWKEAQQAHQREHVMPYFYENPERFNTLHIKHSPDFGHYRWTVDTKEDLALIREITSNFDDDLFSWKDVIMLMEEQPGLAEINASVAHKNQYDVDERL